MKIQPTGNLVLIEPITETERSGITLPENIQESNFGYVRAKGPGKIDSPMADLNEGDKVMLHKQAIWEDVKVEITEGVEMRLVSVNHIVAIMLPEGQGEELPA